MGYNDQYGYYANSQGEVSLIRLKDGFLVKSDNTESGITEREFKSLFKATNYFNACVRVLKEYQSGAAK